MRRLAALAAAATVAGCVDLSLNGFCFPDGGSCPADGGGGGSSGTTGGNASSSGGEGSGTGSSGGTGTGASDGGSGGGSAGDGGSGTADGGSAGTGGSPACTGTGALVNLYPGGGYPGIAYLSADATGDLFFSEVPTVGQSIALVCEQTVDGGPPYGFVTGANTNIVQPQGVVALDANDVAFVDQNLRSLYAAKANQVQPTLVASGLTDPTGLATDGQSYYLSGGNQIFSMKVTASSVSLLAGDGDAGHAGAGAGGLLSAQFSHPQGLAVDSNGTIWVADTGNCCVRAIDVAGQRVTDEPPGSCAPAGGCATSPYGAAPQAVAVDGFNDVWVTAGTSLWEIPPGGQPLWIAGVGAASAGPCSGAIGSMLGVAVGLYGIYVADTTNGTIWLYELP